MTSTLRHLVLTGLVALTLVHPCAALAAELITPELIDATEQEARRSAELAHDYQRIYNEVQRDLDAHDLKLDSGVILSEQYRRRLQAAKVELDKAGLDLRRAVIQATGTRKDANERMFELTYYWGRKLYGFGNKEELDAMIATRENLVWVLLAGIAGLVAFFGRFKRSGVEHITPLEVPGDLREVRLPGLKYAVGWVTGMVADKEMWTEFKQTYHTTTDSIVGRQTYITTETLTKGRLYLLTHDGQEHIYNLYGAEHRFRPGNLITCIVDAGLVRGIQFVTVFNHATREANHYGLWSSNGTPWLVNLAITGVAAWYGFGWAGAVGASVAAPAEHQVWLDVGWAALVGVGLALVCHVPITFLRNLSYKRGFVRKAERLFASQADTLRGAFPPPASGAVTDDG